MAHFHHVTHLMNVFQHHGHVLTYTEDKKRERQWIHGCVAKCHHLSKVIIDKFITKNDNTNNESALTKWSKMVKLGQKKIDQHNNDNNDREATKGRW